MYFTFSIILKCITNQYCAFASTWSPVIPFQNSLKLSFVYQKLSVSLLSSIIRYSIFVLFVFVFVINGLLQIFLSFVLNLLSVLYFCFTIPFTLLITSCSSRI